MKIIFGVIDYKINNITSVISSLEQLNLNYKIVNSSNANKQLQKINALILPGVGSYPEAMKKLKYKNFDKKIKFQVLKKKKPILGICLGMQLLTESSEEFGLTNGLALIPGKVVKIKAKRLMVPNIGWNKVYFKKKNLLFKHCGYLTGNFYHVHSYYVKCLNKYKIAEINYETKIAVAINNKNIYGVQFHPERSHKNGLQLLLNFEKICKKYE